MTAAALELYSRAANSGPPPYSGSRDVPTVFDFDQGIPAPETYPRADLMRLSQLILDRDGSEALEYFDPAVGYEELVYGYRHLREALAKRYRELQGVDLDPRGFILTSGSVQAIALGISAYLDPGDVVAVEASSFPYAIRYMEMAGAEVRYLPIDSDGMDIDALERLVEELRQTGKRLKMVYTIPTFQMPTSTVMSLPRRQRLVDLAARERFIVLEDQVYGELRFAGKPLPTLLSLDHSGLVIQDHAFSKIIAPGLRLGWMAGQPETIAALAAVRQDLGVSQWTARVMTEYLKEGLLEPHLAKVNAVYGSKCATAVRAMREHCGKYVRFEEPQGSFYIWFEIDEQVDWERAAAIAAREGIFFRPGERLSGAPDARKFLRMAYSHVSEDVIAPGIAKLGDILRSCARA